MYLEIGIYISDRKLLENVQKWWRKKIDGYESLTYSQRLKDLDLFSVQRRLLRTDVIKCWKIFHRKCGICPEDIFFSARSSISFHSATVLKYPTIFFQWIVGGGHLFWELQLPGIPYQTILMLLKFWGFFRGPFVVAWTKNCFILFSLLR